jgi:hypothetical protein
MRIFITFRQDSDDQFKEDEMSRACRIHGEKRNVYRILVGTPEG